MLLDGFVLGLPPSTNHYWCDRVLFSRKLQRNIVMKYPSEEAKAYQEHVGVQITLGRKRYWTENPLRCQVVACFSNNGRADIDNRIKPLLDALMAAQVFKDDKQIEELEVRRGPVVKGGRVVISLWEILPARVEALVWVKKVARA